MGAATAAIAGGALLGNVAGSVIGAKEQKKGRQAQERALRDAAAALAGVELPSIAEQEIQLLAPEIVGQYSPEELRALGLDPSAMEQIAVDEALRRQQMESLEGLGEIAEGGLTEADLAASRQIQREVAQSDQARRQSILQNLAQRGTLGSGMELAAQLASAQEATDQQAEASDALTRAAQSRALQALQQSGAMAGNIRSQEFGEQANIARAQDEIAKWNTINRQNIASQNVGLRNQAQLTNLKVRQAQADEAARLRNEQEKYNKELIQQDYDNRIARAGGQASAIRGIGDIRAGMYGDRARVAGSIGDAIGQTGGAIAGYMMKQPTTTNQPTNQFGDTLRNDNRIEMGAHNYGNPIGGTRVRS